MPAVSGGDRSAFSKAFYKAFATATAAYGTGGGSATPGCFPTGTGVNAGGVGQNIIGGTNDRGFVAKISKDFYAPGTVVNGQIGVAGVTPPKGCPGVP